MTAMFLLLSSILILASQGPKPADPAEVVLRATRAIETDSAPALTIEWTAALKRNAADSAALLGLATLARLRYDYVAAERYYEMLLPQVNPGRYTAWASLGRAQGLLTRGQRKAARIHSDHAEWEARTTGERQAQLEAELLRALLQAFDEPASVPAALEPAEKLLNARNRRARAQYECTRANVYARAARDLAKQAAARGVSLAQEVGDRRLEAWCLYAATIAVFGDGDVPAAGQNLVRAAELQRATRDQAGLASTLALGARVLASVANFALARQYIDDAVAAAEASGNQPALASAMVSLARISIDTGDLLQASESAQRAQEISQAIGDQLGIAEGMRFSGLIAQELGAFSEADRLIREGTAIGRRSGLPDRVLDAHETLANLDAAAGRHSSAIAHLDSARNAALAAGMTGWLPNLSNLRLRLALAQNDFATADSAINVLISYPVQPARAYARRMLSAERLAREDRLDEAEDTLRLATDRLDQWRASLSDDRLRLLAYQVGRSPGDPDLGFATIIARLADAGRVANAFRFAEQRRARELLDRFRFSRFFVGHAGDTVETRARVPESATTISEVQRVIPDSMALLEYVVGRGGEPTTLFVVTRTAASALRLAPIDSIARLIERFTTLVEHRQQASGAGRALGKALLADVIAKLPTSVTQLLIVPADVLHRVPFDALVLDDGRYLFERFAVAIAPSAAVASVLWKRPRLARAPRLLAFGDPAFDHVHPDSGTALRSAFSGSGGLPALPGARAEVDAAARYFDVVDARVGRAASEAYFKKAARDSITVLHLATHAQADDRADRLTAFALTPGEGEDGLVHGSELAKLELVVDLVLLSACRTAGGLIIGGEGVQGLTAPLLAAGARSVIATHWRVPDQATSRFVRDVYRALARGATAANALRDARHRAVKRDAPPAEWAAFVLIGDPLTTVPLREPRSWIIWALVGLAGGLLVLIVLMASRKRRQVVDQPIQPLAVLGLQSAGP